MYVFSDLLPLPTKSFNAFGAFETQISVDFAQNDTDVTMLQRSPTYVMSVQSSLTLCKLLNIFFIH